MTVSHSNLKTDTGISTRFMLPISKAAFVEMKTLKWHDQNPRDPIRYIYRIKLATEHPLGYDDLVVALPILSPDIVSPVFGLSSVFSFSCCKRMNANF